MGRSSGSIHTPVSTSLERSGADGSSGLGADGSSVPVPGAPAGPGPSPGFTTGSAAAGFNRACGGNVGGTTAEYVPEDSETATGGGAPAEHPSRAVLAGSSAVTAEAGVGAAPS